MTWDEVIKIALAAIGGVAGIGLVIGAVVKFSADFIAERLAAKYELKLNKEMESFKSGLERKNHISRAMFEKEFTIYQDLINKFYDAYAHIEILNGIQNTDKRKITIPEISMDNPDLLQLGNMFMHHEAITEVQIEGERTEMAKLLLEYRKAGKKSGAFIPRDIQLLFINMYDKAYLLFCGKDENKTTFNDLTIAISEMQIKLHEYLKSLTIVE